MKWIPASERLHKDDHEYVYLKGCRVDKGILRFEQWENQPKPHITLYYHNGVGTTELISWQAGHEELRKIFWLDETEQASPDGWVSVEDRLPELNEPLMGYNDDDVLEVIIENYMATVLAYDENKGIIKAELTKRGWAEISSNSHSTIVKITHWQPLPPLPKKDKP